MEHTHKPLSTSHQSWHHASCRLGFNPSCSMATFCRCGGLSNVMRREDDNACLSVSVAVFVLPSFKYGWQMLGFRYHFLLYFLYRKIIFYFLLVVVGGGQATKYFSLWMVRHMAKKQSSRALNKMNPSYSSWGWGRRVGGRCQWTWLALPNKYLHWIHPDLQFPFWEVCQQVTQ